MLDYMLIILSLSLLSNFDNYNKVQSSQLFSSETSSVDAFNDSMANNRTDAYNRESAQTILGIILFVFIGVSALILLLVSFYYSCLLKIIIRL
jgi:hypothetical protein